MTVYAVNGLGRIGKLILRPLLERGAQIACTGVHKTESKTRPLFRRRGEEGGGLRPGQGRPGRQYRLRGE